MPSLFPEAPNKNPIFSCLCKSIQSIVQNIKPKRLPHRFTRHPYPRRNPQHTQIRAKEPLLQLTPGPPQHQFLDGPRDTRVQFR
ncbi:hypothetical protein CEXT_371641 [Caerostris extrusa]|uniref:Uncharacterized protein n=1 Tax=Caerostris extrusa TaxID=172846 RepID=A0AAV4PRU2_CAEEX|nr:hypothetical protein CEXT_371641 [Caerostris extrusa]